MQEAIQFQSSPDLEKLFRETIPSLLRTSSGRLQPQSATSSESPLSWHFDVPVAFAEQKAVNVQSEQTNISTNGDAK